MENGIGGRSALDYLIKVKGMSFTDAVIQINGQAIIVPPAPLKKQETVENKVLLLPERNENNDRVIKYLLGRGIHRDIIDYCIRTGRLYESCNYHNAVFIGFDLHGIPRYATLRGTLGKRFMGEVSGSDKHFSFSIPSSSECRKLHLFESAIGLLSYCTLELISGRDWRKDNCLSLAGIYMPKNDIKESKLPVALTQYLKDFPMINEIVFHLDNDTAGRLAAKTIKSILPPPYTVSDEPPKHGKDYNDYLKIRLRSQYLQEYER